MISFVFLFSISNAQTNESESKINDTLILYRTNFSSVLKVNGICLFLKEKNNKIFVVKKCNATQNEKKFQVHDSLRYLFDHGRYSQFYFKKNIIEEGMWYFGVFHGNYKCYYKNGRIKEEGVFTYGEKIGKWVYYDRKGKVKNVKQW